MKKLPRKFRKSISDILGLKIHLFYIFCLLLTGAIILCESMFMINSASASPLGPSGLIDLPDTSIFAGTSYTTSGDLNYLSYSKAFLFNNLEGGMLKETSSDNYLFYGKMRIVPDMGYIPSLALGVADINSSVREPAWYISASKNITSLGLKLHLGNMWWGKFKNIPTSEKVSDWYGGAEFTLFNITFMGEYHRKKTNLGIGMTLSSEFNASVQCRDFDNNNFDKIDYKVSYGARF